MERTPMNLDKSKIAYVVGNVSFTVALAMTVFTGDMVVRTLPVLNNNEGLIVEKFFNI